MVKKRVIIPKEIPELLKAGNIAELKKIFAQCEPNALCSRSYTSDSNIFSLTPLPREFAVWAKEQGADVNFLDGYGYSPIFNHASSPDGDVQLLINLGAKFNITMYDGTTPLHEAAVYGRTKAVEALLSAGADVNSGLGMTWGTALESAVRQNQIPYATLLEVCTLLLHHGAQLTDRARNSLLLAEKRFQKNKKKIKNPVFFTQQTQSLQQLYELFGIDQAQPAQLHEDAALIWIRDLYKKEKSPYRLFHKLWDYLVPPTGRAQTAHGEIIRILGKVEHEVLDNGGFNWDDDFCKMLQALPDYFQLGNPITGSDFTAIKNYIQILCDIGVNGDGEKEIYSLCCHAVWWIKKNSQVIAPLPADYSR